MKNVAVEVLSTQGHSVTVTDLYGLGFSPIAQKWDFVATSGGHFNYMLEQKHAANLNMAFSPDVLGEIEKLKMAELVLFITPLWWSTVPAILKGWFDRVLAMGVAWDATPSLSLKADLWNTKLEDTIVQVSAQSIVDRDNGINPLPIPPGLSITRDANGLITALVIGSTNEGTLEQRGVDASILFAPRIGRFGSLRHELRWSRVLRANSNGIDFNGSFNFPKNRASLNNSWRFRAFDAAWNVNMIGKHGEEGSGLNAGSYVTHDVQLGWQTPLKAVRLVVGAINVTEKMPKLVGYDGRPYSYYLYDGYGRQVYGRLEMKF